MCQLVEAVCVCVCVCVYVFMCLLACVCSQEFTSQEPDVFYNIVPTICQEVTIKAVSCSTAVQRCHPAYSAYSTARIVHPLCCTACCLQLYNKSVGHVGFLQLVVSSCNPMHLHHLLSHLMMGNCRLFGSNPKQVMTILSKGAEGGAIP